MQHAQTIEGQIRALLRRDVSLALLASGRESLVLQLVEGGVSLGSEIIEIRGSGEATTSWDGGVGGREKDKPEGDGRVEDRQWMLELYACVVWTSAENGMAAGEDSWMSPCRCWY